MSEKRWIKLYKGIMDSAVWSDALRLKAWIHILLSANYKDKDWFKNGQIVKVRRGQFVTSMRKLSLEWKCSRETARRILEQFTELGMIRHKVVTGKYTVITVVKYDDFQGSKNVYCDTDEATDQSTDQSTHKATDQSTDLARHKNNKNIKKDKNNKDTPPVAPWGAPDAYGAPPPGWDEACEKQFQEDAPQNPGKTRQDWWDFWMADSEGGDDE